MQCNTKRFMCIEASAIMWAKLEYGKSMRHRSFWCLPQANGRQHYNVTSSLTGWAHTQKDPCWDIQKPPPWGLQLRQRLSSRSYSGFSANNIATKKTPSLLSTKPAKQRHDSLYQSLWQLFQNIMCNSLDKILTEYGYVIALMYGHINIKTDIDFCC